MQLPAEVWCIIASYVPKNPVLYTIYAEVCRDSYFAFRCDKLWRQLNPYACVESNFAGHFVDRVATLTRQQQKCLRDLWAGCLIIEYAKPPRDSLDFRLIHLLRREIAPWDCPELSEPTFALCAAYFDYRLVKASELRQNREFMKSLLTLNGMGLQYIDPQLAEDDELLACAVCSCGHALKYVPEDHRNRKLVESAVKAHGAALQFAGPKFQSDREIVLYAVNISGMALKFASQKLRADKEIVNTAVNACPEAISYALST